MRKMITKLFSYIHSFCWCTLVQGGTKVMVQSIHCYIRPDHYFVPPGSTLDNSNYNYNYKPLFLL